MGGHGKFKFSAQCFAFKEKNTENRFLAPNMGSQLDVFYRTIEIIEFKCFLSYLIKWYIYLGEYLGFCYWYLIHISPLF